MPNLVDAGRLLQCDVVDCRPPVEPRARNVVPQQPQTFDYQAKDYDSLLRAMLDLIPSRAPGWKLRGEDDLGMALLELFAYVGDQLSYYQDRVHNEGYLRSAFQYESVRRLLSLVDYRMDPGSAARVLLMAKTKSTKLLPAGFVIKTTSSDQHDSVVFETSAPQVLYHELNDIPLRFDAPSADTSNQAVLAGTFDAWLVPGSWLFFQSIPAGDRSPPIGEWAQIAEPPSVDRGSDSTTVKLRKSLTSRYPSASARVKGNGILATHGESHLESAHGTGLPGQTLMLRHAPLTFVDDGDGVPRSSLRVRVQDAAWDIVDDFIDSGPTDARYRTTQSNDGYVTIHFGNGQQGQAPGPDASISAYYRTGIGEAGLVPALSVTQFDDDAIESITNPQPSFAARQPCSLEEAKLRGPRAMREQNRAVTMRDYEDLLAQEIRLYGEPIPIVGAKARCAWTGSWATVVVSIDFTDRLSLDSDSARGRRAKLEDVLRQKKLAGIDIRVEDARYAPIHIALVVQVKPEFFARQVRMAVENALGPAGFFAPGRFVFGQAVRLSDLYAAVHAIDGVRNVSARRFKRLGDRYPNRVEQGAIDLGPLEVARCDHNMTQPENGVLYVKTVGGKEG